MKVRVDFVKEELAEDIGSRRDIALQLVASAVSLKLRQHKEGHRRETKIVGIDVDHPAVPMLHRHIYTKLHP